MAGENPFADLAAQPAAGSSGNPFADLASGAPASDYGSIREPDSLASRAVGAVAHPLRTAGGLMQWAMGEPEVNQVTGAAEPNIPQLLTTPLRMGAKAAEVAGGAGASRLAQAAPGLPAAVPAALGTAAALAGDPMMWLPEGDAVKFAGAPSLVRKQALEGAKTLAKIGKALGLGKAALPEAIKAGELPGPEAVSETLKTVLGHDPTTGNLHGYPPLTPEEIDKMQRVAQAGRVRPETLGEPAGASVDARPPAVAVNALPPPPKAPANPFADLGELEPGLKARAIEQPPEATPSSSLEGMAKEAPQEPPQAAEAPAPATEPPAAPAVAQEPPQGAQDRFAELLQERNDLKAKHAAEFQARQAEAGQELLDSQGNRILREPEGYRQETEKLLNKVRDENAGLQTAPPAKKNFLEAFLDQPEKPLDVGQPAATGKEAAVQTGSGNFLARYKVVPAESLKPSHNPITFEPNPEYPAQVQERNYESDRYAQENVVKISKELNPANVLSDTPLATDGPPVVTPSGLVMGGNNRAMSMLRAIDENPGAWAKYHGELEARAGALGISPQDLAAAGEHPVLVRELQEPPTDRQGLAQMSRSLNADLTKGKDAAAEAVSLGRAISPETIGKIGELIAEPETTLAEALATRKAAQELVPMLVKDGVLSGAKMSEYLTQNGNLTEAGIKVVQDTMLGHVLKDRDLIAELPAKTRQGVLGVIPDLVRSAKAGQEWDLTGLVKEAAQMIVEAKNTGLKAGQRLAQQDIFLEHTPEAQVIARLLDGKIKPLRAAFAAFADLVPKGMEYDPAQASLLDMDTVKGGLTAEKAFHDTFAMADEVAHPTNPKIGEGGHKLYSFPGQVVDHGWQLLMRTLKAASKGALAPVDEAGLMTHIADRNIFEKAQAAADGAKTFSQVTKLPLSNGELSAVNRLRRFFDPSYIVPRLAEEVATVTDKFFDTKGKYLSEIGRIYQDAKLTKEEGQMVAMALDAHATLVDPRLQAVNVAYRNILNRVADLMKLPHDLRLEDYWPHILDQETAQKFRATGEINLGEDGSIAPLVKTTVNVHQLHRFKDFTNAPKYSYDLLPVLNTYVNTCLKKAFYNPFVDNYTKVGKPGFMEVADLGPWTQKYIENYLGQLQGRPMALREYFHRFFGEVEESTLGQKWNDSVMGKAAPIDKFALDRLQRNVNRAYYRSLLGLAVDTSLKNLFQVTNTAVETGFVRTGAGILKLMTSSGRKQFDDAGVIEKYAKTMEGQAEFLSASPIMKKVDAVLFAPMRFSEYINRGVAFHAGMADGLAKGIKDGNELVRYAKYVVDKTQFRYGIANTSPYMNNPLSKLAYQFSTYPTKEYQFIRQTLADPDKAKMTRLLALHGMLVMGTAATGVNLMNALGWERAGDMAVLGGYVPQAFKNVPVPTQYFSTIAGMRSPFLQTALGMFTGPKGRQLYGDPRKNLGNLAGGLAGVPVRSLNKLATLADEGSGYARDKNASLLQYLAPGLDDPAPYSEPISKAKSLGKFLGLNETRKY